MPRTFTNREGLPLPIFYAIKNDTYEARGDISVTTLIDSSYIRILKKYNEYEEDAADSIYSLMGTGVHSAIERIGKVVDNQRFFVEEKMELSIDINGRVYIVTGTTDLLEIEERKESLQSTIKNLVNKLHDFKNTSVWNVMRGMTGNKKWIQQTNIYAAMLKERAKVKGKEFTINEIYIHCFIRDWNRNKAQYTVGYPELQVKTFRIPIYKHESVIEYIKERLILHFSEEEKYLRSGDTDVTECSPDERWQRAEVWRMVKSGQKRSIRNFTITTEQSRLDANVYYANKIAEHPTLTIEKEPGEDIRCVDYCPVNKYCKYYKKVYGKEGKGTIGIGAVGELPEDKETIVSELDLSI